MQPAQIRVFDGLRLTTEHLNHLQAALRSGVQDLREIVGLGVVYRGFEVVASGDGAITVQPGLAFDFQRNRLVLDEPKTVQIALGADEAQFVCLAYEQIEDGQVEDQFTLIWDSCSIVLQPALPGESDNLIPIAIVSRAADGSLAITSLQAEETEEDTAPAEEEGSTTEPATTNGAASSNDEQPAGAEAGGSTTGSNGAASSAPTNGSEPATEPATNGNVTPPTEAPSEPVSIVVTPISSPPAWSIRQGVERLPGTNGTGIDLAALLIGPLRNRLAGTDTSTGDLRFSLHDADVAANLHMLSLTTHTLLMATITPAGATALHVSATAQGEATWSDTGVMQWGVTTIQAHAGEMATSMLFSDLTERGVAHLPLGRSSAEGQPEMIAELLQHLQIVARVDQRTPDGFKLICNLIWSGAPSDALIDILQSNTPTLQWNGTLAWKAIGQSTGTTNV